MKTVVEHEKYGEICYEESFWLGKQSLSVNGTPLKKASKKVFTYENGETVQNFTLKGNYLFGLSVETGEEKIRIVPSAPWYVYLFAIIATILVVAWGNSTTMALSIFPIIGGAVGGGIAGGFFVAYMIFPKFFKKAWQKLLICFTVFLVELCILAILGLIVGVVLVASYFY